MLYRELEDALGLTKIASWELRDKRTSKNSSHGVLAMFRHPPRLFHNPATGEVAVLGELWAEMLANISVIKAKAQAP